MRQSELHGDMQSLTEMIKPDMKNIYIKIKPYKNEDLLNFFLRLYNTPIKTRSMGGYVIAYMFPETYKDKECTKTQCLRYKNRSLDDLYIILKTGYDENLTKKEFFNIIKKAFDITKSFVIIYCNDVKKFVVSKIKFGDYWSYSTRKRYKCSYIIPNYFYDFDHCIIKDNIKLKKDSFSFYEILMGLGFPKFYIDRRILRAKKLYYKQYKKEFFI